MKRFAILLVISAPVFSSMAQDTPSLWENMPFSCFSPSGKWAVANSGANDPMIIIDFTDNQQYPYSELYSGGSGNYISDTGVVVGYNLQTEKAAVWQNGKWSQLNLPSNIISGYANGITPDGSRIVGNMAPSDYGGDSEGIMSVPCYWDLGSDGKYNGPIALPHPSLDYTGRTPQYITSVRVSSDGKTIAGQMRDYLGFVHQPIMYYQDDNGNWTYELLLEDLFHPEGYELPENPGEAPTQQEYMTPQEIADYDKAVEEWNATGEDDYDSYPDIYDYMTDAEYWDFAFAAQEWNEKFEAYDTALWNLVANVPNFDFNNVYTTSDCMTYATTDAKYFIDEARGIYIKEFVPYVIDVKSGKYKMYPAVNDLQLMVTYIGDDGTVFAQWSDPDYGIFKGYVLPARQDEFIPFYDYVKAFDPSTAEWMEENMTHTFEEYDIETDGSKMTTTLATGIPTSVPDLSIIGFAQYSFWDFYAETQYYGYLISLPPFAGIDEIAPEPISDQTLKVFNLQGVKVLETKEKAEINRLAKGIYIVNGKKIVIK